MINEADKEAFKCFFEPYKSNGQSQIQLKEKKMKWNNLKEKQ